MEVIPAIDLRAGRCVRLRQGDYRRETVFSDEPAAMADHWVAQGAGRLHLVDLDGARSGQPENLAAVRSIVQRCPVPCQFGGGVRHSQTAEQLFDLGLDRVVVGTRAMAEPDWLRQLCDRYPGRICLGLDARGGLVATDGWTRTTELGAVEVAGRLQGLPLAAIVYTDIERDGMVSGVNLAATRRLAEAVQTPVIASGGISSLEEVRALAELDLAGCIVGRALYEGRFRLADAIEAARRAGPPGAPGR